MTMRVMQIEEDWSPDNIRIADRPRPEPGRGEVLLRMEASSVNYRDVVVARRGYGRRSGQLPLVPLSDGAGRVAEVGPEVTRVAVGDLVCPIFNQRWIAGSLREEYWPGTLGGPSDGVMQEFMVLREEGLVRAPRHLTPVQAATLPCAGVTAWNAVVTQGDGRRRRRPGGRGGLRRHAGNLSARREGERDSVADRRPQRGGGQPDPGT